MPSAGRPRWWMWEPGPDGAVSVSGTVGLVPLWLLRWRMNAMTLSEEETLALGVDTRPYP